MSKVRILALAVGVTMSLAAATARAEEKVTITKAGFTPDTLNSPTNAFGEAVIGSTTGIVPSPITHVNVFGPAGVTLDLNGTTTCTAHALKERGAEGCPETSRAGFGGGMGIYELGGEIIEEEYTIDFFLSNNHPGHVEMLVFLSGHSPVVVEEIFPAKVVQGHPPYGLGFSLDVPLIKVLPEASDASAKTAFITLGARNVHYFKKVHGKRKLFHVRGIILPSHCPHGGWPVESEFSFQDGDQVAAKRSIPCPR
jgi:hypothetical protein